MPMTDMLGGTPRRRGRGRGTSVSGPSMMDYIKGAWNANPLEAAREYLNTPDPEGYQRANVLPYATTADGEIEWAVPAMGREIMREGLAGLESANRVRKGEISPEQGAFDAALATMGAGLVGGRYVPKGALTANVWQGSPHKYGPEGASQSLKHIGKGEGAQAYGWGRYDAGAEAVAREYQKRVPSQDTKRVFLDALPEDAGIDDVVALLGKGHFSESQETVIRALQADDWLGFDYPSQALSAAYSKNLDNWDPSPALRQAVDSSGNIYKHDLPDEDIARYLDWDAPLSEQGDVGIAIRDFAGSVHPSDSRYDALKAFSYGFDDEISGSSVYKELAHALGSDKAASEALGEAGIPGLQYYDGMSRTVHQNHGGKVLQFEDFLGDQYGKDVIDIVGTPDEDFYDKAYDAYVAAFDSGGTRNYVTWDQDVLDRMKLLERNGETFADNLPMDEASRMARKPGLRSAAIRFKGKTYEGRTHDEAIQNMQIATGAFKTGREDPSILQGFMDYNGKFFKRDSLDAALKAIDAKQINNPLIREMVENEIRQGAPSKYGFRDDGYSLVAESMDFPDIDHAGKFIDPDSADILAMGGSPEAYAMSTMLGGGNQQPKADPGAMARWLADPRNM